MIVRKRKPEKTGARQKAAATSLRLLLCALAGCACVPPGTEATPLLGDWVAGDRAGQARYGHINITDSRIAWSGSAANPGCSVSYRLQSRLDMQAYPDALPGLDAAAHSRRHQVFRLALEDRRCAGGRSELQFAIAADAPERAELIGYDRDHRPVSWGHVLRPDTTD